MSRYNPKELEPKWQRWWEETGTYTADLQSSKPKYIAMSMFNYPSGAGIHIGHAMNYTISDVKARFKRQQGFESYHPVGWDAFGLPAENYAIKTGVSPQQSMANIIPMYHKQYKAMGWSNDWSKEIATHEPEYYRWTQWIFCELYRNGLVYQDTRLQWWCSIDNSVLANEQVIDGKCWRHDGPDDPPAEKREVKQWFFKITDYADELLEAIDDLDWTESVKLAQKNWIGKSTGAEIDFDVVIPAAEPESRKQKITVFTTRPDTLFGATFMVVAPESDIVKRITTPEQKDAVEKYIVEAEKKTEVERQASKEKTGVFTGAYAINPINNQEIPIWTTDYVLPGYGTGAIMAVPAHDERDWEFAQKFNLPIVPVVAEAFGKYNPTAPLRPSVTLLAYDPSQDKYCVLKWLANPEVHGKKGMELPGGGVEEGESIEQAALREFTEETGYRAVVEKVLPVALAVDFAYKHEGQVKHKRALKSVVVLRVESTEQQITRPKDDYEEDASVKWLTKKELLDPACLPLDQSAIKAAFEPAAFSGEGIMVNSGQYDGLPSSEAREKIVADLKKRGVAKTKVNYRMRDWSVSRQRYWGAPTPIINCPKCGPQLVPNDQLPVVLPEIDDFAPTGDGRSALARAKDWLEVDCPKCGGSSTRETDTMDTYVDSSWYMYRYFDPHNQQAIFDSAIAKKWEPIDFYNGADHATAHLLYARFIARFFSKIGLINQPEPFQRFLFNGKVTASDGSAFSKSKGNGIDPLEIIEQGYGADALRTYLMFVAPLELGARWDPQGVPGTYRFLNRLYNLVQEYVEARGTSHESRDADDELLRVTHPMVKKMTEDIEANRYNTAIAAAMGALNDLYKLKTKAFGKSAAWQQALESLVACVAPFAPHIAEELWHQLGHSTSVHVDTWPKWDDKYLVLDTVTIAVQVNGKLRGQVEIEVGASEDDVVKAAKANEKVASYLKDGIKKTIYVPNKLVNFVVA